MPAISKGLKTYKREWYLKNQERIKRIRNDYYHSNKTEIRRKFNEAQEQILRSWIGIIPEFTQCQMCARDIYLIAKSCAKSIHFDHRNGGVEKIMGSPKHWLRRNVPTPENIGLWKSCNFGMLCWQCNRFLPTKNRRVLIENLMKYMGINHAT